MQQKLALVLLACLMLIIPVTGYTVPRIQTVPGCSGVSATAPAGYGEISFVSTPPGAWISLDGQLLHSTGGGFVIPMMTPATTNAAAGSHTVMIGLPSGSGYSDYSSSVTVCDQQVTYVTATLVPITTTVPTTAAPVRAGITFAQVPVQGTTTLPVSVTTTVTQAASTTTVGGQVVTATTVSDAPATTTTSVQSATAQGTSAAGSSAQAAGSTGSLSVTTTPPGAMVFIDGSQVGVSPVKVPGLSAGAHTVLMKLAGYSDLQAAVQITAGQVQEYSTGLSPATPGNPAPTATVAAPGFELAAAMGALGAILVFRKQ
jgi:hypothetical protein